MHDLQFADHSATDTLSNCVGDGRGQNTCAIHSGAVASNPFDPADLPAKPNEDTPDQLDSQALGETQLAPAVGPPIDLAKDRSAPKEPPPDQALAVQRPKTKASRARAKPIDPANVHMRSNHATPDRPRDLDRSHTHASTVAGHPNDQANVQPLSPEVTPDLPDAYNVGLLIELWRQRQDLRRAEGRLNLQCQAICRRVVGGDKEEAGKLWARISAGKAESADALLMVLSPYTAAMASLADSAKNLEKQVIKIVRPMPLWTVWGSTVRGMAELSFAGMIGEAARMPGAYKSVAALWKRFGLAVIDGGRQRLIAGAENALIHGYSPQRRAYAYTLSTNLMRSQREGDPYRELYDRRKAYELARDIPKGHAHNRALRVMVKELLKDAWVADRKSAAA